MPAVTISSKGGVIIPADLRKKYGLRPGAKVQVIDYGGVISVHPIAADPIKQARGSHQGRRSLTAVLLQEHAEEIERDERRFKSLRAGLVRGHQPSSERTRRKAG